MDASLRPAAESADEISSIYRDMIVVQRKAKEKKGKFIIGSAGSMEFSDGPVAIYGIGLSGAYALSDYFEIGASVTPFFILRDRKIKSQVTQLQLANGERASLVHAEPKLQYMVEVAWLPAYGKDSWGPYHIVRSDTFFRLSVGQIQYQSDSGLRFGAGVGKTFFLSRWFNLRVCGTLMSQESIVNSVKSSSVAGIFEFGSVWYL